MKSILNMRPFQLGLLIVFGLAAVIGLFLFATYTNSSKSNQIGSVVVWGTLPGDAVEQEIAAIQVQHKEFSKISYVQRTADTFDTDLANAIASGSGPDLILISQEQLLAEQSKIGIIPFSAIPQRTYLDTFLPEDQIFLTSTGTYGIPYVLDPLVLYYNRTILASSGVPTPPTTWEAVTGLAPTLTRLGANQGIAQSTIALGTYNNIDNARGILSLLLLQSGTSITQSSATGVRSVFASASTQTASGASPAESVLNFYTQFSDPSRTVYSWNASAESARQAFLSGDLALYVGYASELPTLKASNPNLDFDMAQIPQPQTATAKVDYGQAYAFAVPKASPNQRGALATAEILTNKNYVPTAAVALSMVPAQRTLLSVSPSDAYSPVYYPLALISQGWLSPAPAATDAVFSAMITNITSGRLTTGSAINTAAQAMDSALGQ